MSKRLRPASGSGSTSKAKADASTDDGRFERDVRASLSSRGPKDLEIEFRLGTRRARDSGFVPGVDAAGFARIVETLESSASFVECASSDAVEYYFANLRGRLSSDGTWVEKERISTRDNAHIGDEGIVRASAAYEILKAPPLGATPSTSSFFRKKKRRSFAWTTLPWRVDLTEIESNEDKDSEEKAYEVEIELADPSILYISPVDKLLECGANIAKDLSAMVYCKN
jgi:hypothetical protein